MAKYKKRKYTKKKKYTKNRKYTKKRKYTKRIRYKKITKGGRKWIEAAILDMKKRENN